MDNTQNFNQSQTPSYLIDDYEIERSFTQEHFTEILYIFLILIVIIIRFNKNIFKYFFKCCYWYYFNFINRNTLLIIYW